MSIYTDQAVKELQEKVAWLEKEVKELSQLRDLLRMGIDNQLMQSSTNVTTKANAGSPKPLGLPHGKSKPS